jgi:hypothetical protein
MRKMLTQPTAAVQGTDGSWVTAMSDIHAATVLGCMRMISEKADLAE